MMLHPKFVLAMIYHWDVQEDTGAARFFLYLSLPWVVFDFQLERNYSELLYLMSWKEAALVTMKWLNFNV